MSTAEVSEGKTHKTFKIKRRSEDDFQNGETPALQQKKAMKDKLQRAMEVMKI